MHIRKFDYDYSRRAFLAKAGTADRQQAAEASRSAKVFMVKFLSG